MLVNIILAHRDSIKFMEQQVTLIRKHFKVNDGSQIKIYGYVDGHSINNRKIMFGKWKQLNVEPIQVPDIFNGKSRQNCSASESFGIASQWVYENYIKDNTTDIFVCMENDIFPFKNINIEEYVKDYEICGEVRFNALHLPDRMNHFWQGFIIYNKSLMENSNLWSSLYNSNIKCLYNSNHYWIDTGGESYFWIEKDKKNRKIRQMVTNGNEKYDGFSSLKCTPHNITTDIEHLPQIFRKNYNPRFRVLVYDNCLLHLERMGKENDNEKTLWWNNAYNAILNN
uniref:Uncharacterized protein n=1 Tax=viral metagenome TaxID=1070528 RepID=A0A6C0F9H1_9ZZZZ|tara:strand:- start:5216 stop:6064 length:849 start_codon:yes stop_codon:yes gene_type:complete